MQNAAKVSQSQSNKSQLSLNIYFLIDQMSERKRATCLSCSISRPKQYGRAGNFQAYKHSDAIL